MSRRSGVSRSGDRRPGRAAGGDPEQLLERAESLAMLERLLDDVRSSSEGRLVLIGGEAGVGKTTLLLVFCRRQGAAAQILWGGCEPLRTPRPLGALLDVAEATGGPLVGLVEGVARPYEVAAGLIRELGRRGPTVLVLEDIHWADEATLDVLTLLAGRIASTPTLVLATFRDDELGRADQLRLLLGEVVGRRGRLTLEPLSQAGVAELAQRHDVAGDELFRRTQGNPFFVTEVLAAGGEHIPETVRDAVLARAAAHHPAQVVTPAHPAHPVAEASSATRGFEWGDAGLGAAGTLVLLGTGAGSAAVIARRRGHRTAVG